MAGGADSDDEFEEVVVGAPNNTDSLLRPGDVIVQVQDKAQPSSSNLKNGATKGKGTGRKLDEAEKARINAERTARLESHKFHTVALLANASIRNKWINDPLLHARLISLVPLHLQNNFEQITKRNIPEKAMRGRKFEAAMARLVSWWHNQYEIRDGPRLNVRSQTFSEVQQQLLGSKPGGLLASKPAGPSSDRKGKGKVKQEENEEDLGEVIRSEKSLMKHALLMHGSRDTSAQLFTALCRGLRIPTRLVVSLQSVPWRSSVGKKASGTKGKGKEKAMVMDDEDDDSGSDSMEEVVASPTFSQFAFDGGSSGSRNPHIGSSSFVGKGQALNGKPPPPQPIPKPIIRLRKIKNMGGRRLGGDPGSSRQAEPDPPQGGWPPVFWTEVFSKADGRWIPVDPSRGFVQQRTSFEPPSNDRRNRMVYVVGMEEDGYARDVTPRYAKEFGAKTAKFRPAVGGKIGKRDWWEGIIGMLARPFGLARNDVEDAELLTAQLTTGMPTSINGFKDHPLYVLQRHFHQNQVVHPQIEIGKFRGEPVYSRGNLVEVKTAENWMRVGREVAEGEQPLKWVKTRAVTVAKRRMVEMAQMEALSKAVVAAENGDAGDGAAIPNSGGGALMQGLYAEWQTRLYEPPPVIDGIVPKNDFGNIDLYVDSMLPAGATHLPFKSIAKVARKLAIDFAEAVVGFEFKQRRALPILDGIVVASENTETVLEAYWESAQANEEQERQKKHDRVIKRWQKLVHGLRVKERLAKEYSVGGPSTSREEMEQDTGQAPDVNEGGGFLLDKTDVDVVQKFSLPKFQHPVVTSSTTRHCAVKVVEEEDEEDEVQQPPPRNDDDDDLEEVNGDLRRMEMVGTSPPGPEQRKLGGAPKTMEELADEVHDSEEEVEEVPEPTRTATRSLLRSNMPSAAPNGTRTKASTRLALAPSKETKPAARVPSAQKRGRPTKLEDSSATSDDESDLTSEGEQDSDVEARVERTTKRRRAAITSSSSPAPSAGGPRTLRPRRAKTDAQMKREREMERAYRLAIAD